MIGATKGLPIAPDVAPSRDPVVQPPGDEESAPGVSTRATGRVPRGMMWPAWRAMMAKHRPVPGPCADCGGRPHEEEKAPWYYKAQTILEVVVDGPLSVDDIINYFSHSFSYFTFSTTHACSRSYSFSYFIFSTTYASVCLIDGKGRALLRRAHSVCLIDGKGHAVVDQGAP